MKKSRSYEAIFLPSKSGVIKMYIYGFKTYDSWGSVFASLNGVSVHVKGYNRKKAMVRSVKKLNESLLQLKKGE